ncbi:MAG: SDR family oxidoreductase [Candidatus Scalindua sp.]|jgi:UDP-2-acetamido-2,6-beta-L-arabino-hexul-4-ose reductase|nr:SDR family oxidoreductase [Candidatus Scalindua sp.]
MNVLVTGSNGFIGKNLIIHLNELGVNTTTYTRENSIQDLLDLIKESDFIVHLAGENRPVDEKDFNTVNVGLTASICESVRSTGKQIPILLASSMQATFDNAYGKSKLDAELIVKRLESDTGNPVYICRLPGVFGKWCNPNYNSVVATFCHNISHNLPIQVNDPSFELGLVYIDDVVEEFVKIIQGQQDNKKELSIQPEYKIKLGELATQIKIFRESRNSLVSERVGDGLIRKLYSTYVSYLSPEQFVYSIPSYGDDRGMFAEMLKTKDSGQFSFFTAKPEVTRGGHYHHSKTEKFLVIQGEARFGFRHIVSNETHEITTSANKLKIVETVPGWSHDITNIGTEEMIVMLWANEIFDPDNPDTIAYKV